MYVQFSNISFGQKYPTGRILEITSRKIFEPDGVMGYIETLKELYGNMPRYTGHLGYKKYAIIVGDKITAKYPEIAKATQDIIAIASKNRFIRAKDLKDNIKPILDRFEKEIDIVI